MSNAIVPQVTVMDVFFSENSERRWRIEVTSNAALDREAGNN